MDIAEVKTAGSLTLALTGRIDGSSSAAFEARLLQLIGAGERRLVLDLAGVDYVSSIGLRVLMLAARRLKPLGGKVVVCAVQPMVKEVFEIAGFSMVLPIVDSRSEAEALLA
jgi:stage II sporulation protein AA (anti-sigma F factor antagonist)